NRVPQVLGALACRHEVRCVKAGLKTRLCTAVGAGAAWQLANRAAAIVPLPVERHPPRPPDQPCPEPGSIAKLIEAAVRLGERFLRHVLGIFTLLQYAEGDPERQPRGI